MKSNIVTNLSFKQYQKKYKNYKKHLYSFTKQEVLEFDRQADTIGEKYVLNKRRWALIGDTYYEIPKPIRPMWFKGLSAAGKLATCVIPVGVVGALGGAGYGIYYAVTHKVTGIKAELNADASELIEAVNFTKNSDGDLEATIKLKGDHKKSEIDLENSVIKVDGKELEPETDYTFDKSNGKLVIKKSVIKSNNPKIEINLKKKESTTKITTAEFIDYYKKYNETYKTTENVYVKDQIISLYIDDKEITDITEIKYTKKDDDRKASIKYGSSEGKGGTQRVDSDYIKSSILESTLKEGDYCTIDTDGIITYKDSNAGSQECAILKVSKYGYILECKYINWKESCWKVEFNGAPQDPVPVEKQIKLEKSSLTIGTNSSDSLTISAVGGEVPVASSIQVSSSSPTIVDGSASVSVLTGKPILTVKSYSTEGTADITVSADGYKSAVCKVTVSDSIEPTKGDFLNVYKGYSDYLQNSCNAYLPSNIEVTCNDTTYKTKSISIGYNKDYDCVQFSIDDISDVQIIGGSLYLKYYNDSTKGIVAYLSYYENQGYDISYQIDKTNERCGFIISKDSVLSLQMEFNKYGYVTYQKDSSKECFIKYKGEPASILDYLKSTCSAYSDRFKNDTSTYTESTLTLNKYQEETSGFVFQNIDYGSTEERICKFSFLDSSSNPHDICLNINQYQDIIAKEIPKQLQAKENPYVFTIGEEEISFSNDSNDYKNGLISCKLNKYGYVKSYAFDDSAVSAKPEKLKYSFTCRAPKEKTENEIPSLVLKDGVYLQTDVKFKANNDYKVSFDIDSSKPIDCLKIINNNDDEIEIKDLIDYDSILAKNDKFPNIAWSVSNSDHKTLKFTDNGEEKPINEGKMEITFKTNSNLDGCKVIAKYSK